MVKVAVFDSLAAARKGQGEYRGVADGEALDITPRYQDNTDIYLRVSEDVGPDDIGINGITYTGPATITLVERRGSEGPYDNTLSVYPRFPAKPAAAILRLDVSAIGPDLEETITINFATFEANIRVTSSGDVRVTDNGHRRVVWEF